MVAALTGGAFRVTPGDGSAALDRTDSFSVGLCRSSGAHAEFCRCNLHCFCCLCLWPGHCWTRPRTTPPQALNAIPAAFLQYSRALNIVHLVFDNLSNRCLFSIWLTKEITPRRVGWIRAFSRQCGGGAALPHWPFPPFSQGRVYDGEQSADEYYKQGHQDRLSC